jgi:hypothetical protein
VEDVTLAGRVNLSFNQGRDGALERPGGRLRGERSANADAYGSTIGLKVSTGPDALNDFVTVGFTGETFDVSGYVNIGLSEFVHLSGISRSARTAR